MAPASAAAGTTQEMSMAFQTDPVAVFLGLCAVLQGGVAVLLWRSGGFRLRFRALLGALFATNAALTTVVVVRRFVWQEAPSEPLAGLVVSLDLLTLVAMWWLAVRWQRPRDDPWTRNDTKTAAFLAVVWMVAAVTVGWPRHPIGSTLSHFATYGVYGLLLVQGTRRLVSPGADARTEALLLLAFGTRAAQFGLATGPAFLHSLVRPSSTFSWIFGASHVALMAVAVGSTLIICWAASNRRSNASWTWVAGMSLAAGATAGVLSETLADDASATFNYTYEALQLLTLTYVRPLAIALALVPLAFGVFATDLSVGLASLWSTRMLIALITLEPVMQPSPWWITALLVALAITITFHSEVLRRFLPGGMKAAKGPQYGRRLLMELTKAYETNPGTSVPMPELLKRAGIASGSQPMALREMATLLGVPMQGTGARGTVTPAELAPCVTVTTQKRTGPGRPARTYALTTEGYARAQEALSRTSSSKAVGQRRASGPRPERDVELEPNRSGVAPP